MSSSRTSSWDLHLDVDLTRSRGRRAALDGALRGAIRGRRLAHGTVLPSSRGLAHDLGLGRGTVVEVYSQLLAEGYLVTRPGGRTMVATEGVPTPPAPTRPAAAAHTRLDLRPGLLDLASTFPRRAWLRALRVILNTAPDDVFDYGDPRGRPELRSELASYLARARGVVTTPERIMICAGFSNGLSLVSEALKWTGHTGVAMEDPCLPAHREIVSGRDLAVASLPVDESGARIDALARLDLRAAVLTPAHQYPTGVTLQPARRNQLVAWARDRDGVVIEDDYDGEFRYDRQPVGAVQGLDPDHVIYAGTVSKTMAPGIRIGWLVLPERLVDPIIDAHRLSGAAAPALEQLALAHLLRDGHIDRHLRRVRVEHRKRRDALIGALDELHPSVTTTGIAAGLHLVIRLSDATEASVRSAAKARAIALAYLSDHHHHRRGANEGIVVGYARQAPTTFPQAVTHLIALLREATSS